MRNSKPNLIDRARAAVKLFPQPDPARVLGMDTSFWSGLVNFDTAKLNGIQFVIGKCTDGTNTDPVYIQNYAAAKTAGLVTGAYHWLYASRNLSIDAQVTAFARMLNSYPVDIAPVVDFERTIWRGAVSNPTRADLSYFCNHLYQETGKRAIIYTAPYFWIDNGSGAGEWLQYGLWEANYSAKPAPIAPWGADHKFWQWTANGDGLKYGQPPGSLSADLNYYNGTQEQFNAEFGLETTPPPGAWLELLSVTNENGTPIPSICVVNLVSADYGPMVMTIDQMPQEPPAPPPSVAGLYRIKDDIEAGIKPAGTREYLRIGLPSTVRLKGGATSVRLTPEWMDYVYSIQGNPNYQFASRTAFKPAVGWHNQGDPNRVEQVVFSGNVVEVTRIEEGRAYIKTAFVNEAPPQIPVKPMNGRHPLIQNFSIQYKDHLDITTDGKYARIIVIANPGEELWIDANELVKL